MNLGRRIVEIRVGTWLYKIAKIITRKRIMRD
jgi:hypothetical protein